MGLWKNTLFMSHTSSEGGRVSALRILFCFDLGAHFVFFLVLSFHLQCHLGFEAKILCFVLFLWGSTESRLFQPFVHLLLIEF